MRKNPYLKQEQDFRPLLMRGALGNDFLITSEQVQQELNFASETSKKTYTLNDISFDMVLAPSLNLDGSTSLVKNVEMCTTECTQELFEDVMGFNYSNFKDMPNSAQRPIERVTWFDCIVFCNKLSEMLGYAPYYSVPKVEFATDKESLRLRSIRDAEVTIIGGHGFRLPTDGEWETFAKAGTENEWAGTSNWGDLMGYAWYRDNSNGETHPVATKKPNEWGMYDMSGNVWEWVWDKTDVTSTDVLTRRAIYGGSWSSDVAFLHLGFPNYDFPSIRTTHRGFRFARTIEQQK